MLYQRPSFTCPASSRTSQLKWDLAFLSVKEFCKKYKLSKHLYDKMANEEQGPTFEAAVAAEAK